MDVDFNFYVFNFRPKFLFLMGKLNLLKTFNEFGLSSFKKKCENEIKTVYTDMHNDSV